MMVAIETVCGFRGEARIRHCRTRGIRRAGFREFRATLVAMEDTMSDLYAINLHVQGAFVPPVIMLPTSMFPTFG